VHGLRQHPARVAGLRAMAKRRFKKTKRSAEAGAATVIVLGLGALVAGVAIYRWTRPTAAIALPPIPPTTALPSPTPQPSDVTTVLQNNPPR
jgi:hypothetical protein